MSVRKILHIIPNLKKGGAERLVAEVCAELNARDGIEVELLTFSTDNDYSEYAGKFSHNVVPAHVIPSVTGKPDVKIDDFLKFVNNFQPDVIHSHLFESEFVSRWVVRNGVKYFSHCHDNIRQFNRFAFSDVVSKVRLTELYERSILFQKYKACSNRFIAVSPHNFEYIKKVLPKSLQHKVDLLPNAINVSRFSIKSEKSDNELKLITIGRLDRNKNHQLALEVVSQLKKEIRNVHLNICGEGHLKDELKNYSSKLGIEENVTFHGNVADVAQEISKNHIYIHTAKSESFGLTLVEAMAGGLPVVTSNGGGNESLIEQGVNGYLIQPADVAVFAQTIVGVWKDKVNYINLSDNARLFASRFHITKYVDRLLELYDN